MFWKPKRKHTNNGMQSTVTFEILQHNLNEAGVQETRGTQDIPNLQAGKVAATEFAVDGHAGQCQIALVFRHLKKGSD